eukprot:4025328-Prymnesium_polylepis.1
MKVDIDDAVDGLRRASTQQQRLAAAHRLAQDLASASSIADSISPQRCEAWLQRPQCGPLPALVLLSSTDDVVTLSVVLAC